ncbi:MAG: hypothetical protein GYB49_04585 [Alphaproteobacteria bacterium]|uniref:hypothetical protein n=1 Tax=Hyphomonas oceanitis TaxID=81033 RepID=UPI0030019009|nr:hypothetical protein [Alphaproteobacteria bacterium]
MPVSFTPINNGKKWTGAAWVVACDETLALHIAKVALGQARHVARILRETDCAAVAAPKSAYAGARDVLTVQAGEKPYHRDGWIFQVISWIAAHKQSPGDLIRAPQMIKADKGFDGIQVRFIPTKGGSATVIICEEKATTTPRGKITSQVWPEFESLETGTRDNELVAVVTDLLTIHSLGEEADQIVSSILWESARAYRVSMTAGDRQSTPDGLKKLFKGYEDVVTGDVSRRRAEILHLSNIRGWLDAIANQALRQLDEMEAAHV